MNEHDIYRVAFLADKKIGHPASRPRQTLLCFETLHPPPNTAEFQIELKR